MLFSQACRRDTLLSLLHQCSVLDHTVRRLVKKVNCARRGCRSGAHVQTSRKLVLKSKLPDSINAAGKIPVVVGRRRDVVSQSATVYDRRHQSPCVRAVVSTLNDDRDQLRCGLMNVRSLNNATSAVIEQRIVSDQLDVFAAVETWHDDAASPSLLLACPTNYQFIVHARPRSNKQQMSTTTNHGGVAVFYRSALKVSRLMLLEVTTMECMALKIADQSRSRSVALLVIYSEFFDELQLVLSSATCSGCELVAGDLNVHVDVASDSSGAQLLDTLQHHDLRRHVTVPTHNGGHTLDVVITTEHSTPTALDVCDLCVSDHFFVMFSLHVCQAAATVRQAYQETVG